MPVTLQPLVDLFIDRYRTYLPKLVYPILEQDSTITLRLAYRYPWITRRPQVVKIFIIYGKRMRQTQNDKGCDLSHEPSGYDFLSPCLEEAYLMSKSFG